MVKRKFRIRLLDRLMAAVSFAEAGEHETALELMHAETKPKKRQHLDRRSEDRKDQRPLLRA